MIQPSSRLRVADNTGARTVECIRILPDAEPLPHFEGLNTVPEQELNDSSADSLPG